MFVTTSVNFAAIASIASIASIADAERHMLVVEYR